MIRFTINIFNGSDKRRWNKLNKRLDELEIMMTSSFNNLQESLNKAHTSLDKVVSDIHTMVDTINDLKERVSTGLSQQEVEEIKSGLDNLGNRLDAAADIFDPSVDPEDVEPIGNGNGDDTNGDDDLGNGGSDGGGDEEEDN